MSTNNSKIIQRRDSEIKHLHKKSFANSEVNDNSAGVTLNYLNEKVKYLEIENNELKKEILNGSNEKDKLEYFLRVRKDLLEENERIKEESNYTEQLSNQKIIKLEKEVEKLNEKIKNFSEQKNNFYSSRENLNLNPEEFMRSNLPDNNNENNTLEKNLFSNSISNNNNSNNNNLKSPISYNSNYKRNNSIGNQNLKYFSNLGIENDTEISQNFSELNHAMGINNNNNINIQENNNNNNIKNKNLIDKETMGFNTNSNFNLKKENEDINQNPTAHSSSVNPFVSIIQELEERLKFTEGNLKQKEIEIEEIKSKNELEYQKISEEKQKLQEEFNELNTNIYNQLP